MEPRAVLRPRDSGILSGQEAPRLYHRADDRLSPGSQESPAPRKKIATATIFEAAVSREAAERRLIDDLLSLFGGRSRPIMAHLVESGTLTLDDVREAEKTLLQLAGEEKPKWSSRLIANHCGNRLCLPESLAADPGAAEESRAGTPWGVAGGLDANSSSRFLCSRWAGLSNGGQLRHRRRLLSWRWTRSASRSPRSAVCLECRPHRPAHSAAGNFVEYLGLRIPRDHLLLGAFRWRRIRAAVRAGSPADLDDPDPGDVLPHAPGTWRLRHLPPGPAAARRHLRAPDAGTIDAVIAHELCHVRHRDNLIAAIHMFVETVFWFHPLVWWIGKGWSRSASVPAMKKSCGSAAAASLRGGNSQRLQALRRIAAGVHLGRNRVESQKANRGIMTNRAALRLNLANKAALAATLTTALAIPVVVGMMHAQSPAAATLKFEVASIKPTDPAFSGRSLQMLVGDSIVTIKGMSLKDLIRYAWGASGLGLHPSRVTGGPSWFDRDRYDVVAKSAGFRIPSQDERKQMLRALLSERFQLTFHREPKEIAVYELTVGKNGPK